MAEAKVEKTAEMLVEKKAAEKVSPKVDQWAVYLG